MLRKTEEIKKENGITLIALVITIIVMLVLTAVTISVTRKGGLVGYAEKAADETESAIESELGIENKAQIYENSKWDKKAAPEDAFLWQSNIPGNPGYGVVIGYTAKVDNYPTLRYPSRCTEITVDFYGISGTWEEQQEIRSYTKNIKEIELPNTVKKIGEYAFSNADHAYHFESLKKITIPEGVESIGDSAFCDCENLTSVIIPDSVTSIGIWAFSGCINLRGIIIPNSVISIGHFAFGSVPLVFYSGTAAGSPWGASIVTSMETNVWAGAEEWDKTAAPEDVFVWQSNNPNDGGYGIVVGYTSNVQNYPILKFPSRCKFVGLDASVTSKESDQIRSYIKNIKEIQLPETVIGILDYAFANTGEKVYSFSSLEKVVISDSVKSIGSSAFEKCSNLKEVIIGKSVEKIGYRVFYECTRLSSVTIPSTVKNMDAHVFAYCNNLTNVIMEDGVTTIGMGAFYNCTNLNNITIPNSVTTLGSSAFENCYSLTKITIPTGVKDIPQGLFRYCSKLEEVLIGDNVTSIGSEAFRNCWNIKNLVIPDSVTSIGYSAFSYVKHIEYNGTATGAPWEADSIN